MSDSDDLDLDGGDESESGGSSKKRGGGGLGNLLPTILKFVAIGLGATIFIVTVSVVTYNIMRGDGRSQTSLSSYDGPYVGTRQEYAMYTMLGSIQTRTRDFPVQQNVTVVMIIGYDLNDQIASSELISRQYELRDFVRRYFAGKTAAELVPEREDELKTEIREQLNTRFLDKARARIILFDKLDVMESF